MSMAGRMVMVCKGLMDCCRHVYGTGRTALVCKGLMSTTPHLLCHTPFHYISEVSTATFTNQHNHQNIDVG